MLQVKAYPATGWAFSFLNVSASKNFFRIYQGKTPIECIYFK
jgi:hypothetical protein